MIDIIYEHFVIIVVVALALIIAMTIISLLLTRKFSGVVSNRKFGISSTCDIDARSETRKFSIRVFNRNINDVRITAFGYMYKGQNIDVFQSHLEASGLPETHRLVVASRDSLSASMDVSKLAHVINDLNRGKCGVRMIRTYVVDALGQTTSVKAGNVRRMVKKTLKDEYKGVKAEVSAQKAKLKAETRDARRRARAARRETNRDRRARMWLRIRRMFARNLDS